MSPVIDALARHDRLEPRVICTGQHRELVDDLLNTLGVRVDVDLKLMVQDQTAAHTVGQAIGKLSALWQADRPAAVLVQGDTGTALGAALAGFYERVPVGHVEAGLRTFDPDQPFPEETNRVLIGRLARVHFCPTETNRHNLLAERVADTDIFTTGNTGIDAFLQMWQAKQAAATMVAGERRILVTAHRRENADGAFDAICLALRRVVEMMPDARVVFPVHPNPAIRDVAHRILKDIGRVSLVPPMRYDRFVEEMVKATLIVTDSGGIQEEACTVGKPTLVLRNVTERQEGARGSVRVIGTETEVIVDTITGLLDDATELQRLSTPNACFGDGHAADRIVAGLDHVLHGGERPQDYGRPGSRDHARAPVISIGSRLRSAQLLRNRRGTP